MSQATAPALSSLFVAIADWMLETGAENLKDHPGLWVGRTSRFTVTFNGHDQEVEGVPSYHAFIENGEVLPIAVVYPYGGTIAIAQRADETYQALERHFKEEAARLSQEKK